MKKLVELHLMQQAVTTATDNLLPETSKTKYEAAYKRFMDWKLTNNTNSLSENVLIVYFESLSKNFKSSTLWNQYSMLRSTLNLRHEVDISRYPKLRTLLKRKGDGYKPKKANILSPRYLLTKVALVIGIVGCCRRGELCKLKVDDFEDLRKALLVRLPDTKTKITRTFTITGPYCQLYKKYAALRPPNIAENRFFLNYQKEECTKQVVGINKFGNMPREIADFLHLPNPKSYTGHCFRRSSATMLIDTGGDITMLQRHGGWKSSKLAEGYIEDSLNNKLNIANKIMHAVENIENQPSTSTNNNLLPNTNTVQEDFNVLTNNGNNDKH